MTTEFHEVADAVWVRAYPLQVAGADLRRNTTVIRLASGKTVIHSTAPFSPTDVEAIRTLGEPGWIVDTLLRHDTFAAEGREAFPEIPYLAPPGFSKDLDFPTGSLLPAPEEWSGALEVIRVMGAPAMDEHVVFHKPSRTLIVADLVMNFGPHEPWWTEIMLKAAAVGGHHTPGISRLYRASVEDEVAFRESLAEVLALDFDRVIVGHGDMIGANARALVVDALREVGFALP